MFPFHEKIKKKKQQYFVSEICMLYIKFPNENLLKLYSRRKEQ